MINPEAVKSIDPPPGGETLNIQISDDGSKIWICIDGTAVFRYRGLKAITLENQPFRPTNSQAKRIAALTGT